MKDLLFIIPNLNENNSVIKKNLLRYLAFVKNNKLTSHIIISDGGSSQKKILSLKKIVNEINLKTDLIKIYLCLPAMRPNKNLGILNIIEKFKAKYVVIIDADWVNINNSTLNKLILPLLKNKAKIVLPNIIKKKSARINRLIISPLLRLLFPEISRKIIFPLSGMISIDYDILKKIAGAEDYFWDWGGEAQIIIRGYNYSNGKVKTFNVTKIESKKRKLSSKMKDAFQITRSILYEAFVFNRLDQEYLLDNFIKLWQSNSLLRKLFINWQEKNKIFLFKDKHSIIKFYSDNLLNFKQENTYYYKTLNQIYKKTKIYELLVLANISITTISKILFNKKINCQIVEVGPKKINNLKLIDISILSDFTFLIYISSWLNQINMTKINFNFFINILSINETDYIEYQRLQKFRKNGLSSVDINSLQLPKLRQVLRIYNSNTDIINKNKYIKHIIWKG
ncbi:glycosyltransferase [Candidatus Falkowbacteria bacterium]|nr:glycosyltransferase [Candidatus Falkowbacteria bacterium]